MKDYELQDDNPIEEDYEGNGGECLWCGKLMSPEFQDFCSDKCQEFYDSQFRKKQREIEESIIDEKYKEEEDGD